jgi:copper resistance protein B
VKTASLFAVATLALATPVFAQSHHHDSLGMTAPDDSKPEDEPESKPQHEAEAAPEEPADPHAGHDMSGHTDSGTSEVSGNEPPPAPPADNAADRVFSIDEMDAARDQLRQEHGGSRVAMLLLNVAEYQVCSHRDGYRWADVEGRFGSDINRVVVKSEGEGTVDGGVEDAELRLIYSRAISPYFDLQGGVRYDFEPNPSRTYGTIGFEGLAPYWFEVEGALFLSERADLLARLEGYYDQPITQRLIVQPRAEFNFAAQDVRENGIGSGLSDVELGLRLRYEIRREFAPYLGVSWQRKIGDTATFARREGERVSSTSLVFGIRTWF